jgi:predicted Zn-dependent protease
MASVLRYTKPTPATLDLGRRCDREAIQRDPDVVDPRIREASERIDALGGGPDASLCPDRAACRALVLEHADAIARVTPASSASATLRARLLVAEGKPEEAVKMLLAACDRVTDGAACLRARVAAAARVKAPAMLDTAARELLGLVCVSTVECADTATWLAQLRQERGEPSMALGLLERAAREDPAKEDRWLRLADAASRAGQHAQALDALTKVQNRRGGGDPALEKRIEAERSQVLGGIIMPPR